MRRRGWLNVGKVMLCMCMVTTFWSMFYNQELAHGVPDDIAQELGLPSVNLKVSRWQAPPEKSGEQGQNEENGAHERLVYNKNEWSKDFPREGGPNMALEPPAIGELTVVRGDALIEENNNRNVPNIAVEPSHMKPPVRNDTMEDPKGDDGNLTYSHGRNTRQKISQRATDDTSTVSNARCPTPRTPPRYSKDQVPRDTWQVAEPGISQVFSAYADYRGTLAMIKLIGIRLLKVEKIPSPLKCRVWLKDASEPFLVKAKLSALPEIGKYL